MKKPQVDYRAFRFSKLNTPEYRHMWLLLGWIGYFLLYLLTENLIPEESCHVIHGRLDDLIPFREGFVVLYVYWYLYLVLSLAWFFFYDTERFKQLQIFIIITQAVAMLIYIVYPSVQLLRPEVMPRDNFLCSLMSFIYSFDTPTGVCPSLHVAYSMGIASVWCRKKDVSAGLKVFIVVSTVLISISTAFVKQHSVLDILAAIPLGILAEYLVHWTHLFNRKGYSAKEGAVSS
jgi:hypothetical protein